MPKTNNTFVVLDRLLLRVYLIIICLDLLTGNSMAVHNGMRFSTFDSDHDTVTGENCAAKFRGAWWYSNCHDSNLNGLYLAGHHTSFADGINWETWHGNYYSLKSSEMKIAKL